jgi:hypothetical protein
MLKWIIGIFIFCIVLFLYLHIYFHLKTSNDLEIFEIEQVSKDRFEEICDLRQPILFDLEPEHYKIVNETNKKYIVDNYPVFEVKIRDTIKNSNTDTNTDNNLLTELYVTLPLHAAITLFDKDKSSMYFSENNNDFLTEIGIVKKIKQNDEYLRPHLISNSNYDIMLGSEGSITPFRYNINYRNFFMVTQGTVQIKLAPPKYSKYLYPINDYENLEFTSPVNPWTVQSKYKNEFDKIKCLELTLSVGKCFYIPAYWWYSFQFHNDTSISCFYYKTYMNNVAIFPNICMYFLQNQNVKRKIAKHIEINNNDNEQINVNSENNITEINIHDTTTNITGTI